MRDCIVRKVKDGVKDFGDVYDDVIEYYVDKSKIDKKYKELQNDRDNNLNKEHDDIDDVHALMFEAVKWLHDYKNKVEPYHVYIAWYACRILMLNGLTPVTVEQVFATFKQCMSEFAKCFSSKDDYMEVIHSCSDYAENVRKTLWGVDYDMLDCDYDDTERTTGIHLFKVRAAANKFLKDANADFTLVHKKWIPSDVPYGLYDYLYNGEYNVPNDDDDDSIYDMLYEYEMYVNNRAIDKPRCENDGYKVSFCLYDWRHYKPANDDEEDNEITPVNEDDYNYRTTIEFVVEKRVDNGTYHSHHYKIELGNDKLNKLADNVAEMMYATVNASEKYM